MHERINDNFNKKINPGINGKEKTYPSTSKATKYNINKKDKNNKPLNANNNKNSTLNSFIITSKPSPSNENSKHKTRKTSKSKCDSNEVKDSKSKIFENKTRDNYNSESNLKKPEKFSSTNVRQSENLKSEKLINNITEYIISDSDDEIYTERKQHNGENTKLNERISSNSKKEVNQIKPELDNVSLNFVNNI